DLVRVMVGREIVATVSRSAVTATSPVVLRVEALTTPGRFHDVTFDVRTGEILALAGLVGAGRSSLLGAIFGAVRVASGRVQVGGIAGPFRDPRAAIAAGVAYLPEDRKTQGLMLARAVRENTTLASLSRFVRPAARVVGWLDSARERREAATKLVELQVRAPH